MTAKSGWTNFNVLLPHHGGAVPTSLMSWMAKQFSWGYGYLVAPNCL